MRVEYRLTFKAVCPVDQKPDIYGCVVRSTRTIPVEDILAAVAGATKEPRYQEEITQELHRLLAAEVETTGQHSGVQTTVICGDSK